MITKEEYGRMIEAARTYARRQKFSDVQGNLLEDMIDMIFGEHSWEQIQRSFSSPRVANWTREQLVKAGIKGAKLLTPGGF